MSEDVIPLLYITIILIVVLLIIGALITTLSVGFSPANADESSSYTKRAGRNVVLQTIFYVVGTVLFVILLFVYAL
ncbi:MAG: hypothetical protein K0Q73_6541 [Paenibacillus sp.]|nr:hypothetical protein [Paenibacillus sp.]